MKDLRLDDAPLDAESLTIRKNGILDNLRLIEMYEDATMDRQPLRERSGNWVHKFNRPDQSDRFLVFQFYRYQEVQAYIEEHFRDGSPFPTQDEEKTR